MSELLASEPELGTTENATETAAQPEVLLRSVSVVVPMFNETECLPHLLRQLDELASRNRDALEFEFVFVDDGSTDGTRELLEDAFAERPSVRIISHERNRGIAAAIQTGIRAAAHETVASIDADGSYDLALLDEMIPLLTDGVDMVTASPYHPAGGVENVPRWRLWISKRASAVYRSTMNQKLHCCTSCFRVYRRSAALELPLENEGFVGVAEMAWRLDRQGAIILEHPAVLRTRVAGHSKMKVARATLRHLRFIRKTMFA